MPYKNDPPIDTEIGFAIAEAINEVLSFLVEHPAFLPFVAILASSAAGDPSPIPQAKRALVFFADKQQDFIDAGGALGFVRWARANPDELRELKKILFSI